MSQTDKYWKIHFNFFYRAHIRSEVAANNGEGSVNVSAGLGNQKQDVVEFDVPVFNELKFSHLYHTNDNCDDCHAVVIGFLVNTFSEIVEWTCICCRNFPKYMQNFQISVNNKFIIYLYLEAFANFRQEFFLLFTLLRDALL